MTEHQAIGILARNRISIDTDNKVIYLRSQPGIKIWGVVDFLKTACKYRVRKEW